MKIIDKCGGLDITDLNETEVYEIACKIESDSVRFYADLAKHSDSDLTRDILESLSEEEQSHRQQFQDRLSYLKKIRPGTADTAGDFLATLDYGIFRPFEQVKNIDDLLSDPKKSYEMAILIEKRMIKFYQLCKGKALSVLTEIELDSIIETEKKHLMFFIEKLTA